MPSVRESPTSSLGSASAACAQIFYSSFYQIKNNECIRLKNSIGSHKVSSSTDGNICIRSIPIKQTMQKVTALIVSVLHTPIKILTAIKIIQHTPLVHLSPMLRHRLPHTLTTLIITIMVVDTTIIQHKVRFNQVTTSKKVPHQASDNKNIILIVHKNIMKERKVLKMV